MGGSGSSPTQMLPPTKPKPKLGAGGSTPTIPTNFPSPLAPPAPIPGSTASYLLNAFSPPALNQMLALYGIAPTTGTAMPPFIANALGTPFWTEQWKGTTPPSVGGGGEGGHGGQDGQQDQTGDQQNGGQSGGRQARPIHILPIPRPPARARRRSTQGQTNQQIAAMLGGGV